jgi:hypothetical protein
MELGVVSTPGPWHGRKECVTEKSSDTTGIDPGTIRLVVQHLNHYGTPGPSNSAVLFNFISCISLEARDQPFVKDEL